MNRHTCHSTTGRARMKPPHPATFMRVLKPPIGVISTGSPLQPKSGFDAHTSL
jgi:hypothetical protein